MAPHPTRRDPWPWVGLAGGLAFLVLAALVVRGGGLAFDEPLAAAVQGLPVPAGFWEACTFLGGATILIPIGIAFVLVAGLSRRLRLALIVAIVLIVAALFTELVKDYVARPRPSMDPLVTASGYSFPSGHTLNSTVTYGLLALVAWRGRLPLAVRRAALVVGVTIPIFVGLSRIALGVHWPTDVLAGWLAGVAFVALAATLIRLTGAMKRNLLGRAAEVPATGR
jgi:undecaprenyl-diphosphatase